MIFQQSKYPLGITKAWSSGPPARRAYASESQDSLHMRRRILLTKGLENAH